MFSRMLNRVSCVEFVNAYLLINQSQGSAAAVPSRDRLAYVLDHNNPTPGKFTARYTSPLTSLFQATSPANKVNKSSTVSTDSTSTSQVACNRSDSIVSSPFSFEDTTKTTTTTTTPVGSSKPITTTWEQHWTKLDDGSGR